MSKVQGLNSHRLEYNPLENKFAETWEQQNTVGSTLAYILSGPKNVRSDISERDEVVAATVIQWLGSPVGQCFLEDVLGIEIRDQLVERAYDE